MAIYEFDGIRVQVPASGRYWVADNATVLGKVVLEEDTTIWFNAVLRGDNELITVGKRSNVQDGCVLHTDPGFPLVIEPDSTIGHLAILHGCTIGRGSLIGMGAVVLNGAKIGAECLIGSNALIPEGREIPARSVVVGSPGKIVREVNDKDLELIRWGVDFYVSKGPIYASRMKLQA